MDITIILLFFIYGTILGSFYNVVGLRVPKGTLFQHQRSYCDTCERTLSWTELIPIFSYLFQGGRCKTCREKISPIYPIMEFLTGFLFAYSFYRFGWSHLTILGVLLTSLIIPITVSDIAYQKIPNKILLFFTPLFMIYRFIYPLAPWWDSILGALIAFTLVFLIIVISKGGMGMGDLKYYTLFGLIFGTKYFFLLFFLSTLYGVVIGVIKMKVEGTGGKTRIAFGPFIGLAALTVFFFGSQIINWYLKSVLLT